MDHFPNVLRIDPSGRLFCEDGKDVCAYLAAWAKDHNITPDTPLNVVKHDALESMRQDSYMLHHLAS